MLQSPAGTLWNCTCAAVPCAGPLTSIPVIGQDSFAIAVVLTGMPVDSRTLMYRLAVGPRQAALLEKDGSPMGVGSPCAATPGAHNSDKTNAARAPEINARIFEFGSMAGHFQETRGAEVICGSACCRSSPVNSVTLSEIAHHHRLQPLEPSRLLQGSNRKRTIPSRWRKSPSRRLRKRATAIASADVMNWRACAMTKPAKATALLARRSTRT